jgi:hypothetical protein
VFDHRTFSSIFTVKRTLSKCCAYWGGSKILIDELKECKVGGIHSTRRGNAQKILFCKPEMKMRLDRAAEYMVK